MKSIWNIKFRVYIKKTKADKIQYDKKISEYIDIIIDTTTIEGGYGKPDWKTLYPVLICLLPYKLYLYIKWLYHWYKDYTVNHLPYNLEDQMYFFINSQ